MSLLLDSPTIEDGADIVGQAFVGALACDEDEPAVSFEFWTKHIVGSGPDGIHPWIHWVFPKTVWQLGDNTFEEGIALPTMNGFSRTNAQWGDGPYGDGPPDGQDISEGGWWKTDVDPPAGVLRPRGRYAVELDRMKQGALQLRSAPRATGGEDSHNRDSPST